MDYHAEIVPEIDSPQKYRSFGVIQDVKMPIASSLHEISRIIGPTISKEYMFTALDVILKDPSDSLKLAAISHIA